MKKTTWIALGTFVLLLIAFLISQNIETAPEETPVPTEQPTLRTLDDQDIVNIIYTDSSGNTIELERMEDLAWTSPTHPDAPVTAGNIEELISNLSGLSILSSLPSDVALGDYGLDTPSFTITFTFEDKITYQIEIGSPTALSDGYYARLDDNEILVLPTSTIEYLPTLMIKITVPPTATPNLETTPVTTPTP
jgi:hypothetical protein